MADFRPVWALGLMSGTSMDGVDGAMVLTDGEKIFEFAESYFRPYTAKETAVITQAQGLWPEGDASRLASAARVIEDAHAEVIDRFENVELVGFHGQTLAHDPGIHRTHQLGDGAELAKRCSKRVVWDFRSADVLAGGQGAPLAPFFHFACVNSIGATQTTACLNLGGVGNVTLVDVQKRKPEDAGALLAFDTGPANAPLNDFMFKRRGEAFDQDGKLSAMGTVDEDIVQKVLQHRYFSVKPPKSLDRNDFADVLDMVSHLNDADGAATLTGLIAACVANSVQWFDMPVSQWWVSGGGARNPTLMRELATRLEGKVSPIGSVGLNADMLEAQAFAFLAVRVVRGLPTSASGTTGIAVPVSGGRVSG
jgi:anhydro-N-acetylmuramic acid kinase